MATKKVSKEKSSENPWITQKELAKRWHVSEGTIINLRKKGVIPFFNLPGSRKILYFRNDILRIELENTGKEVQPEQKQPTEFKTKQPVVSARPEKEWRI